MAESPMQEVESAGAPLKLNVQMRLGKRDETRLEAVSRVQASRGWVPAWGAFVGLLLLGVLGSADGALTRWVGAGAGTACLLWALWLLWAPPRVRRYLPVTVMRGPLLSEPTRNRDADNQAAGRYYVGGRVAVDVPDHWRPHVDPGTAQELHVRELDGAVLRYGSHLSVDEELQRIPEVYVGRYVGLGVMALMAVVVLRSWQSDIQRDALHAWAWLRGGGSAVASPMPPVGSLVNWEGPARCTLSPGDEVQLDCTRWRFGGRSERPVELPEPPEATLRLADASWVGIGPSTRPVRLLPHNRPFDADSGAHRINNLDDMVRTVDQVCQGASGAVARACDEVRDNLFGRLTQNGASPLPSWAHLRGIAGKATALVDSGILGNWQANGRALAEALLQAQLREHRQALAAVDSGGTVLVLPLRKGDVSEAINLPPLVSTAPPDAAAPATPAADVAVDAPIDAAVDVAMPGEAAQARKANAPDDAPADAAADAPNDAPNDAQPASDEGPGTAQSEEQPVVFVTADMLNSTLRTPLMHYRAVQAWAASRMVQTAAMRGLVTGATRQGDTVYLNVDPNLTAANAAAALQRSMALLLAVAISALGFTMGWLHFRARRLRLLRLLQPVPSTATRPAQPG